LGQLVRTLVNEEKFIGAYQVMWDGKDQKVEELSSSIYSYKLRVKVQK
jgi:flagellar hook assembly protein FlgD